MAKQIKDRKVYGLVNFRGLDKENKPLKVAPFRASDGKNFIIDSETLKTRPAFKYVQTPLKTLEDTNIIDFYKFRDTYIYVTTGGFHIKHNDKILSSSTNPKLITNVNFNYNFNGLRPYFQEEQECLFIFCMDDIFVLSNLYNQTNGVLENVVFYSLSNKPRNPFTISDSYYEPFQDLPIPYEPTLFIGDKQLDDINLLSKVSNYKIFANNASNSQEGVNTYYLPTNYNIEKHGANPTIDVSFYNNRFKSLEIFPVFLGKLGENFENLPEKSEVLNESNPVMLQDDFVAKQDFEYKGEKDNSPEPIKEVLGLTKEDFFNLKIKENAQRVFEYILNYIESNFPENNMVNNKVLKFTLPYQRRAIYRNETTDFIEKVYIEKREEPIYVQLKKNNTNSVVFSSKISKSGTKVNEENFSNPYPDYPNMALVPDVGLTFDITPTPVERANFTINDFISMANTWLNQNMYNDDFVDGSKVKLLGRMFESKSVKNDASVSIYHFTNYWKVSDVVMIDDHNNINEFPDFPTFTPGTNPVIDVGILSTSGQNVNLDSFMPQLQTLILEQVPSLPSDKTFGYCKFRWWTYFDDGLGNFYEKGQSVVLDFWYTKESTYDYEIRNSFAMTLVVLKDETKIADDLYSVTFDDSMGSFVLKCKDYFYDFNGEPSIDVKITFEKNPDYDIIAKSKFGIAFGSENRLFLAGNEKTPHIDRFNVSNDLLGNNIKNQSYELSYFPSKNYRVLGGKGAINGYVLATDTQLYITKEDYPNDQKLFIRNRTMDDNGLVGYNEFKTNIERSPLNNRSLARFYNDILVLDEKGLYGIEISSNVLTNERLVKMRSGFINKELTKQIKEYGKDNVFIYEDNAYMYIFVGKKAFVADSRYISHNPNSEIENYSYEIVEWEIPFEFKQMKKIDGELVLLDISGNHLFTIVVDKNDDIVDRRKSYMSIDTLTSSKITSGFKGNELKDVLSTVKGLSFTFDNEKIYKYLALSGDFTVEKLDDDNHRFTIDNSYAFRNIEDGAMIVFKHKTDNEFIHVRVDDLSDDRTTFLCEITDAYELNTIFVDYSNKKLYPKIIYEFDNKKRVILSPYEHEEIEIVIKHDDETNDDFFERVALLDDDYCGYIFLNNITLKDVLINRESKIRLKWVSGVLDFGNNFSEKTMFKTNLYATKQEKGNWIKLGYRTMRRFNRFDETGVSDMMKGVESSNPMNFEEVDFNVFAINTLNEFGASIPMKENNFLYIQFIIIGEGNIELNAIEVLYKLNRLLKTVS